MTTRTKAQLDELWQQALEQADAHVRVFVEHHYADREKVNIRTAMVDSALAEPIAAYGDIAFLKRVTLALVAGDEATYQQMRRQLAERNLQGMLELEEYLLETDTGDLDVDLDLDRQ